VPEEEPRYGSNHGEDEDNEDLLPEPYLARSKAEKATAQKALKKALKEAEVGHNCDSD
jgi:hypothetical protein